MARPLQMFKCPRCGKPGSGLHKKWVLNGQGIRYEPYYWVAHSISGRKGYSVKWCYIRKKIAEAILKKERLKKHKKKRKPS